VVFNIWPYTVLPDNSNVITANMQSETGFASSHQLKSDVASKSRLKLAARAVLSADAGLLVQTVAQNDLSYLSDCCPVCLSVLSVTLAYCGQMVGWIEMKLGLQVGLGPGHTALDGDQQQFGCLAGRSTLHALVSALHLWTTSLDTGQAVRTVFVDFSKAFDLVDHNILLKKLYQKSVPKLLCEWFKSFLSQRRQRVRVPGFPCSQWLFLNRGLPQGSLLGPVSFIIHIDDLSLLCNILKYVDDTTLSEIIMVALCNRADHNTFIL